jgi:hypothetical protein
MYNKDLEPRYGRLHGRPSATVPRLYHSNTMLLPDGGVQSNGGGVPGPLTNLNDEIYTPGYLLNDDDTLRVRPVIIGGPTKLLPGSHFQITLDNADNIHALNFISFEAVTNSTHPETRLFKLQFHQVDANTLSVDLPGNPNLT